jgi:hypothetical protein
MSLSTISTYRHWLKSWEFVEADNEQPFAVWKYYTKDSAELPLIQRVSPLAIYIFSNILEDAKGKFVKAVIDPAFLDSEMGS